MPAQSPVRDKSNGFVFGRDPNIVLRWIDRLATAVVAYHLWGIIVLPVALVAWVYEMFFGTHEFNMVVFGFAFGVYHLVVGLLLRKHLVLPLHARLAIADAPPRSYPPEPLSGRTVYQDKTLPE